MNLCAVSSFYFLAPAVLALILGGWRNNDVFWACLICLFTSVAYHKSHDERIRPVDVWVVRCISIFYTLHALAYLRSCSPYWIMAMLAFGCLALGVYIHSCSRRDQNSEKDCMSQCLVHLYSVCGVMCYVYARF